MFQTIQDSRKKIRIFEYYSVSKILESESKYSRFKEKDLNPNRIRIYSIISDLVAKNVTSDKYEYKMYIIYLVSIHTIHRQSTRNKRII